MKRNLSLIVLLAMVLIAVPAHGFLDYLFSGAANKGAIGNSVLGDARSWWTGNPVYVFNPFHSGPSQPNQAFRSPPARQPAPVQGSYSMAPSPQAGYPPPQQGYYQQPQYQQPQYQQPQYQQPAGGYYPPPGAQAQAYPQAAMQQPGQPMYAPQQQPAGPQYQGTAPGYPGLQQYPGGYGR